MTAQIYLVYPDVCRDQFTGTDPDQDLEQFMQLIERSSDFLMAIPQQTEQHLTTTTSEENPNLLHY